MVDIMEQLVEELDDLPSDLVEIVLSQFVPKKRVRCLFPSSNPLPP